MLSRLATLIITLALAGCASMAAERLSNNLTRAVLDQEDPETVRMGAPAYLLLIDGMLEGSPDETRLLLTAAKIYGAYAGLFTADGERRRRLSDKARRYAHHALCLTEAELCAAEGERFDTFAALVSRSGPASLELLYGYAGAWLGWIEARSDDWSAVADLPKVEALLERVAALDDGHDDGRAHLYLGILKTLRPASLGGQPEQGRIHFERAIELSAGRDLIVKVEFARRYARPLLDRPLFERLLNEVIDADPHERGLTLINVIAQQEAHRLRESATDYFPE